MVIEFMKVKKLITFWVPFAILVVIGRRILDYGFGINVFKSGFIGELLLGVIICVIVVVVQEKRNKEF